MWPHDGLSALHDAGFSCAAMALTDYSVSLDDPVLQKIDRLAIFMGTEGAGLVAKTIAGCDHAVRIPMAHGVDSLNVAAASAVAFWQLCPHVSNEYHYQQGLYQRQIFRTWLLFGVFRSTPVGAKLTLALVLNCRFVV